MKILLTIDRGSTRMEGFDVFLFITLGGIFNTIMQPYI